MHESAYIIAVSLAVGVIIVQCQPIKFRIKRTFRVQVIQAAVVGLWHVYAHKFGQRDVTALSLLDDYLIDSSVLWQDTLLADEYLYMTGADFFQVKIDLQTSRPPYFVLVKKRF